MLASCVLSTKADFTKRNLRFLLFLVKIWFKKACERFTLPVPVSEKRFLALELDFIFGI